MSMTSRTDFTLERRFLCVMTTPFGVPVVPEE